jgi:hypothetical protein
MKYIYLLFTLTYISVSVFSQQNTVDFEFKLNSKSMFNGGILEITTNIDSGSFKEGENYILPVKTLDNIPSINPAYDAIEGAVFKIDSGAINENLYLEIILSSLITNTGLYEKIFNEDLFLKLEIIVRPGKDAPAYEGNYYLNEDKFLTLTIEKGEKFRAFVADSVGLDLDSLGFAYIEETGFNGIGITTIDLGDSILFKAEHMSKFGGGKGSLKTRTITSVRNESLSSPASAFILKQNYPNPFNPETSIEYSVPGTGYVELNIYNILGENIEQLVSGNLPSGTYRSLFSSSKFTSGVYLYELRWNNSRLVRKMILMK